MKPVKIFSILALTLLSQSSRAADVFIEGGLHFGGDTLGTVFFVGGGSESVKAGELLSGSIGLTGELSESLVYRASLGVKMDFVSIDNGDVDFTRFPLEYMLFTSNEDVNFGLGLSYHLDPEFTASGNFIGTGNIQYDDALGFVAELDYVLNEKAYLGLKATFIDYEVSGFSGSNISGNSLGVVIGFSF